MYQSIENITFIIAFAFYVVAALLFLIQIARLSKRVEKVAIAATIGGLVFHTIAMAARSIGAGRLPFSNQYEFALSFAWGITLSFVILYAHYRFGAIGAFVMPLAILVMGYASMQSKTVRPLMPALQSIWLTFHVGTAILSYGSFALACAISVIYLIDLKRSDWSRYWAWDPKETWSLITWIIYAIYLHLRLRKNWRGKSAAWFSIIGFVSVIFTFVGVNVLLPSIHSYVS